MEYSRDCKGTAESRRGLPDAGRGMGRGRNAAPTKRRTAWAGGPSVPLRANSLLPHEKRPAAGIRLRRIPALQWQGQAPAQQNGNGRRGSVSPPYNGRGKPLPNRTATAGGDRCPRPTMAGASPCPTERQRAAGIGVPALQWQGQAPAQQNGNGRRGSVSPPYRTATGGGDRCPRPTMAGASPFPTERQRPAGMGMPALHFAAYRD